MSEKEKMQCEEIAKKMKEHPAMEAHIAGMVWGAMQNNPQMKEACLAGMERGEELARSVAPVVPADKEDAE